jgi:hypothetical protein
MIPDLTLWILLGVILIVVISLQRDTFNSPDCTNDTPYELKIKRDLPWSSQRSRIYYHKLSYQDTHIDKTKNNNQNKHKTNTKNISQEKSEDIRQKDLDRFKEFLGEVSGSVQTKDGPVSIKDASGFLRQWSYKPFREGQWEEVLLRGLPNTMIWYSWRGSLSILPSLTGDTTTSPLTQVISEEEILIPLGGTMTVRIYPPKQPGIPKFTIDRHGDYTFCSKSYRLSGREIEIGDGYVLSIPRGWVYKATIDRSSSCFAIVRVPIWSPLSWMRGPLRGLMKGSTD